MNWFGPLVVLAAVMLVNNIIVERQVESVLERRPDIMMKAFAAAKAKKTSDSVARMQSVLTAKWDVLSRTHAYAVRFDGSRFTSRLVRIDDVAKPNDLNLVVSDYRCTYCKADRDAISALMRAHPNQDFLFIEASILGPESLALAREALLQSRHDEADYYSIRYRLFDSNAPLPADTPGPEQDDANAMLAEQKQFLDTVGIFSTPTYVRDGVVRFGKIDVPEVKAVGG
jgi:protein-disulfide isomerase